MPYPQTKKLSSAEIYDKKGKPRPEVLKDHFFHEGRLAEEAALRLIADAANLLRQEKTLLEVEAPVTGTTETF